MGGAAISKVAFGVDGSWAKSSRRGLALLSCLSIELQSAADDTQTGLLFSCHFVCHVFN